METALILLAAVAGFLAASLLSLYSYGRFAKRAQGERSTALALSGPDTALDRLIAPLLAERPGQSGLVLLDDNLEAFATRALAARRAGRSLDLQYYIWKNDLTGRLLAHEVLAAADRGVRVRLLLDDINAYGHDRTYLTLNAHRNIEVRLFNPSRCRAGTIRRGLEMLLRALTVTRRMHNKAWIADGRLAVVGGRNVGDAYFDAASTSNFRDVDLLLLGAAVEQTEAVFDDYWNSRAALPITALATLRRIRLPALRKRLARSAKGERARPYLARVAEQETIGDRLAGKGHIHWTTDAQVLSDPSEKVDGTGRNRWLMRTIHPLLTSATAELALISPYFIPGSAGTSELVAMAARGVDVAILTNSLAATDVVAVHGAYARYRQALVDGGVRLLELKPFRGRSARPRLGSSAASLHTKAFTVDEHAGFVGSMNFDPRSISLNTEMGVFFANTALVRELREVFTDETSPEKSYRIEAADGRIVWWDDAAEPPRLLHDEPHASAWRRLASKIIGLLPIHSQL